MEYQKIGSVIRSSTPSERERRPRLTPQQIEKLKTLSNIALAVIAGVGIIALSAIAPNIFVAVDKIFSEKYPNRKFSKREKDIKVSQTFYYMKRSGFIRMKPIGSDFKIFLTKLGKKRLGKLNFENMVIKRPSSWDGKWWQVAADIPTKRYRRGADLLREKLKELGFYPLQRTLWFYPYDPREEIEFIVKHYGIERFVTVMEVSRLDKEDEAKMKQFFKEERLLK